MTRIHLALFVLMTMILTSCSKSDDVYTEPEEQYDFPLTDEDLVWIPYKKGDVFRMKHNKGFEVEFLLDYVKSSSSTWWPPIRHYNGGYQNYEGRSHVFSGDFPEIELQLYIGKKYYTDNDGRAIDYLVLRAFAEGALFPLLDRDTTWNAKTNIIDSVYISGKWRKDVFFSDRNRDSDTTAIYANKLWYNAKSGFLKLVYTNNDSLVIK
jgi:hypothetical protein